MSAMALAPAGRTSTLNPNAPLFVPAAFQQVEDFSPEWYNLVKTSTWFREYWVQQQEQESFYNEDEVDDIADLLPESFDLCIDEDFVNAESAQLAYATQQGESTQLAYATQQGESAAEMGKPLSGAEIDTEALIKNLSLKSPKSGMKSSALPAKYWDKPAQCISPKYSPRRIQQPR